MTSRAARSMVVRCMVQACLKAALRSSSVIDIVDFVTVRKHTVRQSAWLTIRKTRHDVNGHLRELLLAHSTFALRFGYAVWLLHLKRGDAPGFAEIGRAVTRTGQAVSAWAVAEEAPVDYRVHGPLAAFLSVEEGWLVKNVGDPPRPDLWKAWTEARALADPAGTRARDIPLNAMERVSSKKPTPKRRANGR